MNRDRYSLQGKDNVMMDAVLGTAAHGARSANFQGFNALDAIDLACCPADRPIDILSDQGFVRGKLLIRRHRDYHEERIV